MHARGHSGQEPEPSDEGWALLTRCATWDRSRTTSVSSLMEDSDEPASRGSCVLSESRMGSSGSAWDSALGLRPGIAGSGDGGQRVFLSNGC